MKILKQACIALALLAGTTLANANNPNSTLRLTIVNNTGMELVFTTATAQNPGNIFTLQTKARHSQDMVIEGVSTQDIDLAANLHFTDSLGHDHVMLVIDPRNKHIVQPMFSMRNAHLQSVVIEKTRGDNSDPNGLFLAGVVVRIDAVS